MQAFSNYDSSSLYLYFVWLIERNFGLRNCLPRLRTSSFDETVAISRRNGIACFAKFKIQSDGLISMRTTNILHFVSQDYVLRPTVPPIVFSFHVSSSYVFTGLVLFKICWCLLGRGSNCPLAIKSRISSRTMVPIVSFGESRERAAGLAMRTKLKLRRSVELIS